MMKNMRQYISKLLIVIICVISIPVYGQGEKNINTWFESEFIDAKRYDLYDKTWNEVLKDNASEENIDTILSKVEDKLMPVDKYINKNFQKVKVDKKMTRGGFLKSLYNLEGIYETDKAIMKEPISHLQDIGVLKGNGRGLALDSHISNEEAIVFAKRMVDHVYNKKSTGAKGVMWQIEKNATKVYMLGSLDLGDSYIYPLSNEIMDRYREANEFMVHVNLLSDENIDRDEIYYDDGETLRSNIGDQLYERLKETMEAYDLEEEYYEDMKAWAVLIVLSNLSLTGDGGQLSNEHGVTNYLTEKALDENKIIVELEGLDYQYELLDKLSLSQQIELLDDAIKNIYHENINEIDNREYEERVAEAWRKGDQDELKILFKNHNKLEDVNDILLLERDRNIANKISQLLESGEDKTYFISLHSVHYLFEGTIIDSLRSMGYDVKYLK